MRLAELRSNEGGPAFALDFERRSICATDLGFEASVPIRGRHWDGDHDHVIDVEMDG